MNGQATEQELIKPCEASRRLGVHTDTLRRWADDPRSGLVAVVTPGGHYRYTRASVERCCPQVNQSSDARRDVWHDALEDL